MEIFNSQTRKKEEFIPLEEGHVKMYVCGPTVYDFFHIGNARPLIVFDILRRYFEYLGYKVTFVQNFTDIDDKMIRRANQDGITVKELGDRFIDEYYKDASALGVRKATVHPRATEHIGDIINMVKTLEDKGFAYEINGDVYFDTKKDPGYGKLSGQSLEDLNAGARVEIGIDKKNPADFALWKAQKPGEPAWDSPWGKGRPGWHIECSAMSRKYLGDTFDIHAGGKDLLFPHHENEVAQSECTTGKTFARYWMHNGFINIENEKMSKSLGNFFTVRDIVKQYDPIDIRMFMVSAHYRSPLNFSKEMMAQAHSSVQRLTEALRNLDSYIKNAQDKDKSDEDRIIIDELHSLRQHFKDAMDDDLNTAEALSAIFDGVRLINTSLSSNTSKKTLTEVQEVIKEICDVLGLYPELQSEIPEEISIILDKRAEARKAKNWTESDSLRDILKDKGYLVKDTPDGQVITKI